MDLNQPLFRSKTEFEEIGTTKNLADLVVSVFQVSYPEKNG